MPVGEDIFRFKRFDIIQNHSVHRVGTDGVLLGAWIDIIGARKILDVGTGTGVIALMLAQRTEGIPSITALEPDVNAYELAVRNIRSSEFSGSIEVINKRVQDFEHTKFDLIVCNPPFFINSLKPPTDSRARQRHSVDLSHEDLVKTATSLLTPEGKLGLVLPFDEGNSFIQVAGNFDLHLSKRCDVYAKAGKDPKRYLLQLSLMPTNQIEKTSLTIMQSTGEWTSEYKSITREFYFEF